MINREKVDFYGRAFYNSRSPEDFVMFYNYFSPIVNNYVGKNYPKLWTKTNSIRSSFFTSVYQFIEQYDETRPFSGWCFGILKNECLLHLYRPDSKATLYSGQNPIDEQKFNHNENNIEEWIDKEYEEYAVDHIQKAIETLEPMYKDIIYDKYTLGLKNAEIEVKYGWNKNTVKTRLRKAIHDIRVKLYPHEDIEVIMKSRFRKRGTPNYKRRTKKIVFKDVS